MPGHLTSLLTHENPDLDATLSVWLMRRFGEHRYPGVTHLPVMYVPAGMLPDGLTADALERTRGILAMDTGGGRLDTHSQDGSTDSSKQGKSAASLVAEDLNVADMPELQKLLQFVTLQETRGRSIASSQPMDHLVSLPNLLRGLNLRHYDRPDRVMEVLHELYDAAFETEREWFQALQDYTRALTETLPGQVKLVAVESDTGAAVKVARMNKADLVIHRNGRGQTGVTARNQGRLSDLDLGILAEVYRIAEATLLGESPDYTRLRSVGVVHGWYLHDSRKILSKGSAKNRQMAPTLLSQETLLGCAAARLDPERSLPASLCGLARSTSVRCEECPFFPLALPTCDGLRKRRKRNR